MEAGHPKAEHYEQPGDNTDHHGQDMAITRSGNVDLTPFITSGCSYPDTPIFTSATPVMKFASSEARNRAAFATSQAVPIFLRRGTLASRMAAISARLLPVTRARVSTAIGVSMSPGRMTLARTPNSAFWIASCWV